MKRLLVILTTILASVTYAGAQSIWDLQHLASVKGALDKPVYATAYKQLLDEAGRLMTREPVAVTTKEPTPVSGDKHDYMSLSRYYWPDTTKADGLPYIVRDGLSNPELEKYDRNKLSTMTTAVTTLSLAWYFSGEEQYARRAVEWLKVWFLNKDTRMNPNLNYAQVAPGLYDGHGRCYGVIDAYSFVEMLEGVQLLQSSASFSKKDQKALKAWFSKFLTWMLTSKQGIDEGQQKNNHAVAYDCQVIAYALYVGDKALAERMVREFPAKRIYKQIMPDGSQPQELRRTLAFGYSQYNLSHMIDIIQVGRKMGIHIDDSISSSGSSFYRAVDFLLPYVGGRVEQWPYKQIREWDYKQNEFCKDLYRAWLLRPSRGDYKRLSCEHLVKDFSDRFFLLYFVPEAYDNAFARAAGQLRHQLQCVKDARAAAKDKTKIMPRCVEKDGGLRLVGERDWCSGFFPGELWMMYQYSRQRFWRQQAVSNTWLIENIKNYNGSHDLGFMMNNSFGNAYRVTGEESFRDVLIQAAQHLITRFDEKVGCIRSWSWGTPDRWQFAVIIDNMMNLELLFEAYRLTDNKRFYDIAVSHAKKTLANHFRDDYSSYHVVDYDPETGAVIKRITHQGVADESVWSRGQAWGLYGFTMCYRYTHDKAFLNQACHIADFFFSQPNMPEDMVPYWDMRDPAIAAGQEVPRDASAAAIFASGLYELASYVGNEDAGRYLAIADKILDSLVTHYQAEENSNQGFLLLHSTDNKPAGDEIDVPINYADYYYLEALSRQRSLALPAK